MGQRSGRGEWAAACFFAPIDERRWRIGWTRWRPSGRGHGGSGSLAEQKSAGPYDPHDDVQDDQRWDEGDKFAHGGKEFAHQPARVGV